VEAVRRQVKHGRYEPDHAYGDGFASDKIVDVLRRQHIRIQKTITY
jgi:hypothetical protein